MTRASVRARTVRRCSQRPALVALSASSEGSALALERTSARLVRLRPRPIIGFGGRAFNLDPELRLRPHGQFLGEDAAHGAAEALALLRMR